jgi:hypothetical protein
MDDNIDAVYDRRKDSWIGEIRSDGGHVGGVGNTG